MNIQKFIELSGKMKTTPHCQYPRINSTFVAEHNFQVAFFALMYAPADYDLLQCLTMAITHNIQIPYSGHFTSEQWESGHQYKMEQMEIQRLSSSLGMIEPQEAFDAMHNPKTKEEKFIASLDHLPFFLLNHHKLRDGGWREMFLNEFRREGSKFTHKDALFIFEQPNLKEVAELIEKMGNAAKIWSQAFLVICLHMYRASIFDTNHRDLLDCLKLALIDPLTKNQLQRLNRPDLVSFYNEHFQKQTDDMQRVDGIQKLEMLINTKLSHSVVAVEELKQNFLMFGEATVPDRLMHRLISDFQ